MLLSLLLTGCCLKHDWMEASCTNPKSCSKCDATEGDALGHNWQDADCENPKICNRCSATEGEALGHNYSSWTLSGQNEMTRTCFVCNGEERSDVDRELIGKQLVTGKWIVVAMLDYDVNEWEYLTLPIFTAEFRTDGTGTVNITSSEDGTLTFEGYNSATNEYRFGFFYEDGRSLGFDYDETDDTMFTFGTGMALAWLRD